MKDISTAYQQIFICEILKTKEKTCGNVKTKTYTHTNHNIEKQKNIFCSVNDIEIGVCPMTIVFQLKLRFKRININRYFGKISSWSSPWFEAENLA